MPHHPLGTQEKAARVSGQFAAKLVRSRVTASRKSLPIRFRDLIHVDSGWQAWLGRRAPADGGVSGAKHPESRAADGPALAFPEPRAQGEFRIAGLPVNRIAEAPITLGAAKAKY